MYYTHKRSIIQAKNGRSAPKYSRFIVRFTNLLALPERENKIIKGTKDQYPLPQSFIILEHIGGDAPFVCLLAMFVV